MKIYWDLIQCSPEWHELKYGKVGGSTSKGLFVPSDTLLYEILAEHTEDFILQPEGYVSDDMERGNRLEPVARAEMSKFAKVEFLQAGWIESDFSPLFGVSPDGITADGKISCEVKCPGAKKHIQTVHQRIIPSDNVHQCLHYFTVNDTLEKHYYGTFRPECLYPLWVREITRDSLIDLGTPKTPNVKKVSEWVGIAKKNALILEANLQTALANLERI